MMARLRAACGVLPLLALALLSAVQLSHAVNGGLTATVASPCRPRDCLNGGACGSGASAHRCKCADDYGGARCELAPPARVTFDLTRSSAACATAGGAAPSVQVRGSVRRRAARAHVCVGKGGRAAPNCAWRLKKLAKMNS